MTIEAGRPDVQTETAGRVQTEEPAAEIDEHGIMRQLVLGIVKQFPRAENKIVSVRFGASEYISVPAREEATVSYFVDNILKVMGTSNCDVSRSGNITRITSKDYLVDIYERSKNGVNSIEIAINMRR